MEEDLIPRSRVYVSFLNHRPNQTDSRLIRSLRWHVSSYERCGIRWTFVGRNWIVGGTAGRWDAECS